MDNKDITIDYNYDKMIIAVIQNDDFHEVVDELNQNGFYVTVLHSSGGFLKKQNATIMIVLDHLRLSNAIKILKHYGERTKMKYNTVITGAGARYAVPISTVGVPIHCGGIVIFVLDVTQYEKF